MPSKLRKAIGAVKDQTSISLAKVTNAANLEVVILKATTHDEIPMEERYINEIVSLVSSSKVYAAACAQSIGKRIGRTRNWVVALKSLMIVLRIFQDGDPYFPREVFHAMKRGARIVNLSGFRDDSSSSPWDYTAFVRTIALYLDERLDCFLTGKLQRRITLKNQTPFKNQKNYKKLFNETGIKDMKPSMLLDRISYWQRLLDRAMGTRPTGAAKTNRLVQISLYAVVQETIDLYRDISDGLAVILDSFFKLPCKACISAFQACVKSCKQFDELSDFYSFCVSIGVGRSSEYPPVQKISEELMEALQEFLRDQAANPSNNDNNNNNAQSSSSHSPLSKHLLVSALRESVGVSYNSGHDEGYERYGTPESYLETGSEHASSRCTSLEDLMSATDAGILTPRRSTEMDYSEQDEKQSQNNDDVSSAYESCSNHSYPIDQAARSSLDLVSLDEEQNGEKEKHRNHNNNNNASKDCWELVLVETATTTPEKISPNNNAINTLFDHHYNPFLELEDTATVAPPPTAIDQRQASFIDFFDGEPGFQTTATAVAAVVAPTFKANQDSGEAALMAPTFTAQSSSFETDLTLIFGDLNSNISCAMPPTFRSRDFAENNMALVPAFQDKNLDEMTSAPIFHSQGSFKSSSAPTFNSQDSFKIRSASPFEGHNSYQTSTAPTFNSQSSFKISSASTSQGHDSYLTSTAPTFNSQGSFKISSASTSQGHDSYLTSTAPTFNSQGSFKISSASTSQSHDSYHMIMVPTFHDHSSYQTSREPTFQGHNSYLTSTAPTFQDNNSYQTSTEYSFQSHNSYQTSIEPTFLGHSSCQMSAKPTFQGNNSYQTSSEPTFQCQNSFQTSTRPTFHGHSSSQTYAGQTFHAYNSYLTSTTPAFYGNNSSCQTSKELTCQNHNSYQTSTAPSFHAHNIYQTSTTPTPTFRVQNSNLSMAEAAPTVAARNPNGAIVHSTFWGQNFHHTMAAPTFLAKISDEPMLGAPKEDDLFGPWHSSLASKEDALDKSMQELSLVQQQQIWLEQQNKIIEKHMT